MSTVTQTGIAQQLTIRFEEFNQELIGFATEVPAESWNNVTAAEGWPICVAIHHIGVAHYPIIGWVELIANGQQVPDVSMEMVDQINAQHAEEFDGCSKELVIDTLQVEGQKVTTALSRMSDEQLNTAGTVGLFGQEMSARQLFEFIMFTASEAHLESMKAAI